MRWYIFFFHQVAYKEFLFFKTKWRPAQRPAHNLQICTFRFGLAPFPFQVYFSRLFPFKSLSLPFLLSPSKPHVFPVRCPVVGWAETYRIDLHFTWHLVVNNSSSRTLLNPWEIRRLVVLAHSHCKASWSSKESSPFLK